jgi:hypothetical protein
MMKATLLLVISVFSILLQVSGYAEESRVHDVECKGGLEAEDQFFDWHHSGPQQFLEALQREPEGQTLVYCFHAGWLRSSDIDGLIALLDSTIPCSSVASGLSSRIARGSTVGHEAAFLIEGFRRNSYPPTLNSRTWKADRDEILEWWAGQQGR